MLLTTQDLKELRDAVTNVFAPGVDAACDGLHRLQERGYVSTQRTYAIGGHVDVTEAGYAFCERAGITVHRPLPSWYAKAEVA